VGALDPPGYAFTGWTLTGGVKLVGGGISSTNRSIIIVTPSAAGGKVTANYQPGVRITPPSDANRSLMLYFDSNNRLQVGTWPDQANASNIAFFKFGSVVGLTKKDDNDTWGAGDIKFNPTATANSTWEVSATGYTNIPAWLNYTKSISTYGVTANANYITNTVHTLDNVKKGWGDPCMLVGLTGAEVAKRTTIPTGAYRMPTNAENSALFGHTSTAADNQILNGYIQISGSSAGVTAYSPNNDMILPVVGYRLSDGNPVNQGTQVGYWSATPSSNNGGYNLFIKVSGSELTPSNSVGGQNAYPIRCVKK
jgi:uncharacterized protein (TIGR02145 family)